MTTVRGRAGAEPQPEVDMLLARLAGRVIEDRYLSWPPAFLPSDTVLVFGLGVLIAVLATITVATTATADVESLLKRPAVRTVTVSPDGYLPLAGSPWAMNLRLILKAPVVRPNQM